MTDNDRPQDVGRAHRRRGTPRPETELLLERYRGAMRRELAGLLDELEPAEQLVQTSIDGAGDKAVGLGLAGRRDRWELAIKLARELAGAIEPEWTGPRPRSSTSTRTSKPPRLSARERHALE